MGHFRETEEKCGHIICSRVPGNSDKDGDENVWLYLGFQS